MTRAGRRRVRLSRDLLLFGIAAGLLIYEVTLGGGRPDVLTVCVSLLVAPGVLRIDEARRRDNDEDDES